MKAPYRFISLNKEVIYPEWSDKVSHDIPLKNNISGEIEIKITAQTPIYIKDSESEDFFNFNGKYIIPGSSIKGMLRNIIEVISFSKLYTDNKKFAYRDLNNPSYKQKAMNTNKIYYGWLKIENGEWKIESLGKIKFSNRIKYFDNEFINAVGERENVMKIKKARSAYKKYKIVNNKFPQTSRGYIVFTGTTGNKSREFIFEKKQPEKIYILDKQVVENFKNAYYIGHPTLENENWKELWKKLIKQNKEVPVFFQLDENGNIKHFGLSMLYKLPYENSTYDLLKNYQDYKNKADFAETLFGYIGNNSLKGRVFISHHVATKVKKFRKLNLILATPRPTFYLHYLKQADNKCITYDNKQAVLSGFKFYPHKRSILNPQGNDNQNVYTKLCPLDKGSEFVGKIRFFNINPVELGAIFSALTFFNKDGYYHKLGMGKPYGLGSVKIEVKTDFDIEKYIKIFEDYVLSFIDPNEYNKRKKELLKYHSFSINENELRYLSFPNEYKELKRKCINTKRKNKKNRNKKQKSNNSMGANIRIKG